MMGKGKSIKMVIITLLVSALFGVIGALYYDVRADINTKAEKAVVEQMACDVSYIRARVDELADKR